MYIFLPTSIIHQPFFYLYLHLISSFAVGIKSFNSYISICCLCRTSLRVVKECEASRQTSHDRQLLQYLHVHQPFLRRWFATEIIFQLKYSAIWTTLVLYLLICALFCSLLILSNLVKLTHRRRNTFWGGIGTCKLLIDSQHATTFRSARYWGCTALSIYLWNLYSATSR